MRKEAVNISLILDEKDEFDRHWGKYEYLVAGLRVWTASHEVLYSNCFSICSVNNSHG